MSTPSSARDSTSPMLDYDDVNDAFIATPSPSLQSPSPVRVRNQKDSKINKENKNSNNDETNNNKTNTFHEKYEYTIQYDDETRRNNIYDVADANDYTPTGSYDNKYIRNHNLPAASKENTTHLKQPLLGNTNNNNENTSNETLRHSYNSINHKPRNDSTTSNKYQDNIHVQEEGTNEKEDGTCCCNII